MTTPPPPVPGSRPGDPARPPQPQRPMPPNRAGGPGVPPPAAMPGSAAPVGPRVDPYRVVVVDDHAMFRTGVKAEIGRSVAVVGEAADADRAIAVVLHTRPDVVLLDVHLPGGGGIEVLRVYHAARSMEQLFDE